MRSSALLMVLAAATAASLTAQQPATGSVAGRVRYVGRVPEPVYVFESGQKQAIIALDGEKGVAAAVVSVQAPHAAAAAESPEITVNQRNWWFTPAVVAVRAGQAVRFTNDDPSNHNVRSTTGLPNNRFSAYTGTGQPYVHRFRANPDASPSIVTCDIHAWMMAWVYVFDHPHFAQTDRTGRFSIPSLAPGRHVLTVQHGPSGLSRDAEVVISAGRESWLETVFDTADLRLATGR